MRHGTHFPRGLMAASLAAGLILAGCGGGGGGGDSSAVGGGGTVTAADTTVGAITGFGSIIVNGVRFDDDGAAVNDDFGDHLSSDDLRLGMTVEIHGKINDDGTGSASDITLFSELKGPVSDLDAAAGTFSVLGFAVVIDGETVFDDISGLDALADGDFVEVFGARDGNTITASRIEKKDPNTDADLRLRGQIENLDTAATSFTLGTVTIDYSTAAVRPNLGALEDGAFVKVRSDSLPNGDVVQATRVQVVGNIPFSIDDGGKVEINGVVSDFTSISSFVISGVTVDATNATFLRGDASQVGNGSRLEVEGPFANGVLTARKVKFEDGAGIDEFELHGVIDNFVSLADFQVRGVTVDASGDVSFERGTADDVADGRVVEVEGSVESSDSGTVLVASKLKFEDVSGGGGNDDNGRGNGDDNGEFEFKGTISSIDGDTLVVDGRTVTIDSETAFRRITQSQLVVGAFVEIKGELLADGSVNADRISLED